MKRIHLLAPGEGEGAALLAEVAAAGARVGVLELGAAAEGSAAAAPPTLAAAVEGGARRAVAAAGGGSVAVKPRRGPAVLGDLLREHFLGCELVLVTGAAELPVVERGERGWRVVRDGAVRWEGSGAELAASLRRPRPW